jgi:hypothetical protein
MAIVNMSVDTVTRQAAVTVDGVIVPAVSCSLDKYVDSDGESQVHLSFMVEATDGNGLAEMRMFYLPPKNDPSEVEVSGLASKAVVDPDIRDAVAKYMADE